MHLINAISCMQLIALMQYNIYKHYIIRATYCNYWILFNVTFGIIIVILNNKLILFQGVINNEDCYSSF